MTIALIIGTLLLLLTAVCIGLSLYLIHRRRELQTLLAEKNLLYSSPASIPSNRFVRFPTRVSSVSDSHSSSVEGFRLELIYRLDYSRVEQQVDFQLVRMNPIQSVIDECFSSFVVELCLFSNDGSREIWSSEDPINEWFRFHLDPSNLRTSYLKVRIFGHDRTARRLELGQTVFVIDEEQGEQIIGPALTRFIPIYENRIDLITNYQVRPTNRKIWSSNIFSSGQA
jgi:hypothetical protein